MNKVFMEFMRKNYSEVLQSSHAKHGSVVRVQDCLLEEQKKDDQPASIDMGLFITAGMVVERKPCVRGKRTLTE